MNTPLPDNIPPSARVGLDAGETWSAQAVLPANVAERARLARHTLIHALLPLALEDSARRCAFTERTTATIMPGVAPFTRQVVEKLSAGTTTRVRRQTTRTFRPRSFQARGTPSPNPSSRSSRTRLTVKRSRIFRLTSGLMFGSLLAACLVAAVLSRGGDASVATLAQSESATWMVPPGRLTAGVRLQLTRGLAELALNGKGRLVLEGPADLELVSATRVVLHNGRLVLSVTAAGHGYRVDTPSGTFTDLGTQFGVSVAADGTTEAHVMEGSISAHVGTSATDVILKHDDAARISAGRLEHIAADPGAFYTALPAHTLKAPPQIHWSLDEGSGTTAHAEVRGFTNTDADLRLKSVHQPSLPQWISGHRGSALAFDGRGGYAESDFPGVAGTQARTVACWIKMPRDFTAADGFAIVSWGHPVSPGRGEVWQISLNPMSSDGPLGRIRVGNHGGLVIGSTDLRDDRWHHVAVVMFGGIRPNIGTHVLVYLDGNLEQLSRRTLLGIDTRILDDGHGVWIGRNVTHTTETLNPQGFLRGAVDEVVITADALTQMEIRALMR